MWVRPPLSAFTFWTFFMMWNETSKWAKANGYKMSKKDGGIFWLKLDNPEACGIEKDVDDVAKAIFNHMTNNKWVEYQNNFKRPED